MALQGTIESFGISEIFQLVSHQGKTGVLEIQTQEGVARLRFLDGSLLEAWPGKNSPGEFIGQRLVRAGKISESQLDHALGLQKESLKRLGDILVRMGAIRSAEFRDLLALQHRETVYKLLRLKRGRFRFVPEPVEIEEGVSIPTDVGSLLMEGFRQIDEWPRLQEKFPSEKKVYGRPDRDGSTAALGGNEALVLGLVDGVRSVREVADRSCLGEFAAYEALVSLYERGLIVPVNAAFVPRSAPKAAALGRVVDAVAAVGLLAVAAFLLATHDYDRQTGLERLQAAAAGARLQAQTLERRAERWNAMEPSAWPEFPGSR